MTATTVAGSSLIWRQVKRTTSCWPAAMAAITTSARRLAGSFGISEESRQRVGLPRGRPRAGGSYDPR